MKLYIVERFRENKNGLDEWVMIIGIFKNKGNAALCLADELNRPVPCKCRLREINTDLTECGS